MTLPPHFFTEIFFSKLEGQQEHLLFELFDLKREAQISLLCQSSQIQEAERFRYLHRARKIANFLIDEKKGLDANKLTFLIEVFEKEGHIAYFDESDDLDFFQHCLRLLQLFASDQEYIKKLKKFGQIVCFRSVEELIRHSFEFFEKKPMTEALLQRAVLSALLCPLRQNVGSCFATAPAILIHEHQVHLFLEDLYEILTTGKLTRTFGGVSFVVPISPNTGIGDLNKKPIAVEQVYYCPGLLAAFAEIDLLDSQASWEQQLASLRKLCAPHIERKNNLTIGQLIEAILLHHFHLQREELTEFEQRQQLKPTSDLTIQEKSRKTEQIEAFKALNKSARLRFKAFVDHPLSKIWEYTLASFSDVKMQFSNWNLFHSLGLDHEEKGGIGEIIYKNLEEKLKNANQQMEKHQIEYEIAFDQVRATERLLKNAGSEAEARRLKAEHIARVYHMQACLDLRNVENTRAKNYAEFFSFLIRKYSDYFPNYFQEIYDAEMQDVTESFYDDSPAGFRLLFKHGRADPTSWTFIYDEKQYIQTLIDFFLSMENILIAESDWEEAKKEITELTTLIIHHLRDDIFLKTAYERVGRIFQRYNRNFGSSSSEKKPWAYISGGTMDQLLRVYFKREHPLSAESRWVESPTELFVFILDVLRTLPHKITDKFKERKYPRLLIQSPTHAFTLLPSESWMRKGYEDEGFTYTWARDEIILPRVKFFEAIMLEPEQQIFLIERFCVELPLMLAHQLQKNLPPFTHAVGLKKFRDYVAFQLHHEKYLAQFDGFLYMGIPLIIGEEWKENASTLFPEIETIAQNLPNASSFIEAERFRNSVAASYLMMQPSNFLSFPLHEKVFKRAEEHQLASPFPFIFADTNWSKKRFAFIVNPGTFELELWTIDRVGLTAQPMYTWKKWVDGTERDTWTIYHRPDEYYYA